MKIIFINTCNIFHSIFFCNQITNLQNASLVMVSWYSEQDRHNWSDCDRNDNSKIYWSYIVAHHLQHHYWKASCLLRITTDQRSQNSHFIGLQTHDQWS